MLYVGVVSVADLDLHDSELLPGSGSRIIVWILIFFTFFSKLHFFISAKLTVGQGSASQLGNYCVSVRRAPFSTMLFKFLWQVLYGIENKETLGLQLLQYVSNAKLFKKKRYNDLI